MSGFLTDPLVMGILIGALVVLAIVSLAVAVTSIRKANELQLRIDHFMGDLPEGASLEEGIADLFRGQREMRGKIRANEEDITRILEDMHRMIQKVGVVKYDAFAQMGGRLSYAIALMDQDDNGLVINSIHSMDSCYTYTKILRDGASDVELGSEEAEAVRRAQMGREE